MERSIVKLNGGIARHLEGWQPGLLAVSVAFISAMLAVPRSVPPAELPEPILEPRAIERVAEADRALARAAERERLDADVRLLGSAFRAFGRADADNESAAIVAARRRIADALLPARALGDEALARLRAYQLRSFLRELHRWEETGEESDELRELGGPFIDRARRSGWIEGRRLVMDDAVRATLFKKRWNELTLVRGAAFDPSIIETRALYRFLLLHPPHEPAQPGETRAAEERAAHLAAQYRLKKIDELQAIDPSYPADLARGVVHFWQHRYPQAVEAFRRHIDAHPDGPFALRAQNYLRAALGAASDAP